MTTRWILVFCIGMAGLAAGEDNVYTLEVRPPELKKMTDPQTGAELTFLTTDPAHDQSLYYEQRSWLADSSLILFNSARDNGGTMGFLTATGELVRLATPKGGLGGPTAANVRNSVYAIRGSDIVELALDIQTTSAPSIVTATERVICTLGPDNFPPNTALTENADGTKLALGVGGRGQTGIDGKVIVIDVASGQIDEVYCVPGEEFSGHVVFSRVNPTLVSFCEAQSWLTVVDTRTKQAVFRHKKVPGEFATHHCWWLDDLITFCGGFHPQPNEDADVKTLDIRDGTVRIVGKGSWWPGATPAELAKRNWWHAAGSEKGRWIAADNWHGDIGIFHAKTTRTYILTQGHRTYGQGTHPEVGWDRRGEQVILASHLLGNVDVCVATIPEAWQKEWDEQISQPSGRF